MIHGCYSDSTGVLHVMDAGARCPRRTTSLNWNQTGPQGPAGATGAPGPRGPAGPGYDFTTSIGTDGPTLTSAGTYFVDVSAVLENTTGTTSGLCVVSAQPPGSRAPVGLFTTSWAMDNGTEASFSFDGMIVVPPGAGAAQLHMNCNGLNGGALTVPSMEWWVSPVATTPGTTVSAKR